MELTIKCFGKTKELEKTGNLKLSFDRAVSVADLRTVLIEKFSATKDASFVRNLINDCAIADSQKILRGEELISEDRSLVLLPPVCGG